MPGWSGTPRRPWGCHSSKSRPTSASSPIVDVDWLDGHGAALAGVAHLLGASYGRVYVPATDTYATLVPLGSHPLVDPLWSSERVELVHDGASATRLDKLRLVDTVPVARETLHVCVHDDTDEFNCGRCWKCVITMVGIRVLGLDDRFPTLPVVSEREFLQRVVESGTDASVRSWDRHRATWAPYLAEARRAPRREARGDGSRRR